MKTRNLPGFTKDDSDRIGFAVSSVFYQAITKSEFTAWALDVFVQHDDAPLYLMDISEHSGFPSDYFKIIGFVPHWPYREKQHLALLGIGYLRGHTIYDPPAPKDTALRILDNSPEVLTHFRREFPGILIPDHNAIR